MKPFSTIKISKTQIADDLSIPHKEVMKLLLTSDCGLAFETVIETLKKSLSKDYLNDEVIDVYKALHKAGYIKYEEGENKYRVEII